MRFVEACVNTELLTPQLQALLGDLLTFAASQSILAQSGWHAHGDSLFTHIFWASIVLVLNEMVLVLETTSPLEYEYEYRPAG